MVPFTRRSVAIQMFTSAVDENFLGGSGAPAVAFSIQELESSVDYKFLFVQISPFSRRNKHKIK